MQQDKNQRYSPDIQDPLFLKMRLTDEDFDRRSEPVDADKKNMLAEDASTNTNFYNTVDDSIQREDRVAMAEKFLNTLYGKVTIKIFGYLWTKQDKKTYPFDVSSQESRREMARRAIELNDSGFDIYYSVNLGNTPPPEYKRFTRKEISLQVATVTDIDVEGGAHISNKKKKYAPTFDAAKSFLPFTPSLIIDSGYGMHALCLYAEPIPITDDNRKQAKERNEKFLDVIRNKAGVYEVDGVGDLSRVLRVPGTFNYKCGRDNAPLCRLVDARDVRFTTEDIDDRLTVAATTAANVPIQAEDSQDDLNKNFCRRDNPARATKYSIDDDPAYKEFRILGMLDRINIVDGEYEKWCNVGFALCNEGMPCSIWENWCRTQPEFKEGEPGYKWGTMRHQSTGITIATLHQYAQEGGYSERDRQAEWFRLHPELSTRPARQSPTPPRPAISDKIKQAITTWKFANPDSEIAPAVVDELGKAIDFAETVTAKTLATDNAIDDVVLRRLALLKIYCSPLYQKFFNVYGEVSAKKIPVTKLEQQIDTLVAGLRKTQKMHDREIAEQRAWQAEIAEWQARQSKPKNPEYALTAEQSKILFDILPTDLGNAERLHFLFNKRIRFNTETDCWLTFDASAGIWQRGNHGTNSAILPFAKKVAMILQQNMPRPANIEEARANRAISLQWQCASKVSAAISMLRSSDSIRITTADLDRHSELLNCKNGVVNLQDGIFYANVEPSLLITQQAGAAFVPGCRDDTIDKFLRDVQPDDETRNALLRFLGYCLTAEVIEEKAIFIWGFGGNGKGTLTKSLIMVFGDYAASVPVSAVIETGKIKDAGAATTELNCLEKCRLGIVEELPQGGKLDVAKFKALTGGDKIPIRRLHEEFRTVEPTHKLLLSGNHLPQFADTRDPGLLRRLLNVNFSADFTRNPDRHLKQKLSTPESLSALLGKLVTAAQDWYRDGLVESALMKQARRKYVADNDFLGEFVDEFCQHGENLKIDRKSFLNKLKTEYPSETARFTDRDLKQMIERVEGVKYSKLNGVRVLRGIGWARDDTRHDNHFDGEPVAPDEIPDDLKNR